VMMVVTSIFFAALAFTGPLVWWHGLVLLAGLVFMLWDNYRISMAHRAAQEDEVEGADASMGWVKIVAFIILGLIGLGIGARFLVDGAVVIARDFGVSETVIGLTLVAIGTSMPELVTSIIAAIRKQADVAMGNVIGSNIFNILGILGVTSLIAQVPVPQQILTFDNFVMIGVALLLAPFVFAKRDMGRVAGVVFVGVYVAYALVLLNIGQAA
jgi:cation:H+ antiporter